MSAERKKDAMIEQLDKVGGLQCVDLFNVITILDNYVIYMHNDC